MYTHTYVFLINSSSLKCVQEKMIATLSVKFNLHQPIFIAYLWTKSHINVPPNSTCHCSYIILLFRLLAVVCIYVATYIIN